MFSSFCTLNHQKWKLTDEFYFQFKFLFIIAEYFLIFERSSTKRAHLAAHLLLITGQSVLPEFSPAELKNDPFLQFFR